jgi:hypothetical protein
MRKMTAILCIVLMSSTVFATQSIRPVTCKAIVFEGVDYSGAGPYMEIKGPMVGYSEAVKKTLAEKGYEIVNTTPSGDFLAIDVRSAVHDIQFPEDKEATRFCFATILITSEQNPRIKLEEGQFLIKSPLSEISLHGKPSIFRGCDSILNTVKANIPTCRTKQSGQ